MKFLEVFKSYSTEEDAKRIAELHEESPENSDAIRHLAWDQYSDGFDRGILWGGVALLGSWAMVKGLEFFGNRKKK